MLDTGMLRQRVTWQKRSLGSQTKGAGGQARVSYAPIGSYWAAVEPLSGREAFNAQQLVATTSYRITLRNVGAILPGDRLLFESTKRIFEVVSVFRQMERNAYLIVTANELLVP